VLGILVCLGTVIIIKIYISQPILYKLFDNRTFADTLKNLISAIVLLAAYILFSKYYEHRNPHELSVKHLPKEMTRGLILGFATISLSVLILYLAGYYRIITVSTSHYSLKLFTLLLVAALTEDLLIRGLIIRVLDNWLGSYITLIVAMLFETLHVFNANSNLMSIIFDLIWGFTMAMLYIYSKRIWLPFFFHVGWNFAQPFYGSNLTGLNSMGTIIQSEFKGPVLFTGGAVGIEGSIFTCIFLLLIGIITSRLAYQSIITKNCRLSHSRL
jgi:membrane protease YdiL (CAAX protease family)